MERLTITSYKNACKREMICRYEDCDTCEEYCPDLNEDNCPCLQEVLEKLAEYEDMEDKGRLIKSWCSFGDELYLASRGNVIPLTVYQLNAVIDDETNSISIIAEAKETDGICYSIYHIREKDIGEHYFLTYEDAVASFR